MQSRWRAGMRGFAAVGGAMVVGLAGSVLAQRTDVFVESRDHPAIAYTTRPTHDVVAELNEKVQRGTVTLAFDRQTGYLRATLDALKVPVSSQSLVFSQTSAQADMISPRNPRAIYFNDTTAVAWVRGSDTLELAVQDPAQGVVFYTIPQKASPKPRFTRDNDCLLCHLSWDNLGVPGTMALTTFPMSDDPNSYASGFTVDHRTPLDQRWGGWYVTGRAGNVQHFGNVPVIVKKSEFTGKKGPTPRLATLTGTFDTTGYPTPHSDVVALMVLDHQVRMMNLITRTGWEARVAPGARVTEAANELVDYLVFVDEAPLQGRLEGSSTYAAEFAAIGPRDSKGRSLRNLDLERHMMRYPCSYMIYTPAFDALPPAALAAVYRRLWQVLSGEQRGPAYAHLTLAARQAIVEILRETKPSLPAYFQRVER